MFFFLSFRRQQCTFFVINNYKIKYFFLYFRPASGDGSVHRAEFPPGVPGPKHLRAPLSRQQTGGAPGLARHEEEDPLRRHCFWGQSGGEYFPSFFSIIFFFSIFFFCNDFFFANIFFCNLLNVYKTV